MFDDLFLIYVIFAVGDSKPNGQEDISPYATFHLLGMREEAKNNGMQANAANFQTMQPGQQVNNPSMAPTTPRHMSQTMNVSSISEEAKLFFSKLF